MAHEHDTSPEATFGTHMAFMAHIPHCQIESVMTTLLSYDSVGEYLVGLEGGEYEHMHFYVEMSARDYKAFAKRVFIERFKLRGRAAKGLPRQYGKVKAIDNHDKMAAYTLKDGNIRTNIPESRLDALRKVSFQKNADQNFRDEMVDYVERVLHTEAWRLDHLPSEYCSNMPVAIAVAQFMREKGKMLRKTTIQQNVYYVWQHSSSFKRDTRDIVHHMFGQYF